LRNRQTVKTLMCEKRVKGKKEIGNKQMEYAGGKSREVLKTAKIDCGGPRKEKRVLWGRRGISEGRKRW